MSPTTLKRPARGEKSDVSEAPALRRSAYRRTSCPEEQGDAFVQTPGKRRLLAPFAGPPGLLAPLASCPIRDQPLDTCPERRVDLARVEPYVVCFGLDLPAGKGSEEGIGERSRFARGIHLP